MIKDLFLKIAGGSSGGSSSTTSTKVEIPPEFEPYLYGKNGATGILPTAEKLYKSGQLSPAPTNQLPPRQLKKWLLTQLITSRINGFRSFRIYTIRCLTNNS